MSDSINDCLINSTFKFPSGKKTSTVNLQFNNSNNYCTSTDLNLIAKYLNNITIKHDKLVNLLTDNDSGISDQNPTTSNKYLPLTGRYYVRRY